MKTSILTLLLLVNTIVYGQNNSYEKAMSETLAEFGATNTIEEFKALANKFERIGTAEKEKWLPYYYSGFSYVNMNFMEADAAKKEKYLAKAQELCNKAFKTAPKESELYILQAMIYSGILSMDPMGLGMEYAPKLSKCYAKAIKYNPDNPRTYFMQGNQIYHTPVNFGGGVKNSLPLFETAKEKYDNFKPESLLHPNWGKEENLKLLAKCKENN